MLAQNIINTYSQVQVPITYTNNDDISFEGSQKQSEFFRAWNLIEDHYKKYPQQQLTFLEIGAWKGLWGLAFMEFCKMYKIQGKYLTITMIDQDPNNQPLYKTLEYLNSNNIEASLIDINTLDDQALPQVLKYGSQFNIVFIDAGHAYNEVMNDIQKFASLATDLLLFHDIRPREVVPSCGVYQALLDSNIHLDEEIVSSEGIMGIGIVYKK